MEQNNAKSHDSNKYLVTLQVCKTIKYCKVKVLCYYASLQKGHSQ